MSTTLTAEQLTGPISPQERLLLDTASQRLAVLDDQAINLAVAKAVAAAAEHNGQLAKAGLYPSSTVRDSVLAASMPVDPDTQAVAATVMQPDEMISRRPFVPAEHKAWTELIAGIDPSDKPPTEPTNLEQAEAAVARALVDSDSQQFITLQEHGISVSENGVVRVN